MMMIRIAAVVLLGSLWLAAPAAAQSPFAGARSIEVTMTRHPRPEICIASQYGVGDRYHGRRTACGSIFNTYASNPFTAAHRTRACGSMMTVTNLANGRSVRARVTDRGPFVKGRCVDLGRAGANAIGMGGLAQVRVE